MRILALVDTHDREKVSVGSTVIPQSSRMMKIEPLAISYHSRNPTTRLVEVTRKLNDN